MMNRFLNKSNTTVLMFLLVSFIISYQLFYIFFGLDFQDSFYHINRMIANNPFVMAFMSYKIGYFWSLLIGRSVLGFRVFNAMLYVMMLVLPILCLKEKKTVIVVTFVTSFYFALMNWNLIGYDTFSVFFMVLVQVNLIIYFQNKSRFLLFLVALFSAFCISSRLPNMTIFPVVLFLLFFNSWLFTKTINWKEIFFFIVCFFTILLLSIISFYKNFTNYLTQLELSLLNNEDHSFNDLISGYVNHFVFLFKIILIITGLYWIYSKINTKMISKLFFIGVALIGVFLYIKKIYASGFNTKVALFLASLVLSFLIIEIFVISKKKEYTNDNLMINLIVLSFLFLPCLGSNSGLKYAGFGIVFFPLIYSRAQLKHKSFFMLTILVLLPFAILEKYNIKFMDKSQDQLKAIYTIDNIKGIHTLPKKVDYVNSVVSDYKQQVNSSKKIVFYGLNSHVFNYLLNNSVEEFDTFAMKLDNNSEKEKINKLIIQYSPVFFITSYDVKEKQSPIERFIVSKKYSRNVKENYAILTPLSK